MRAKRFRSLLYVPASKAEMMYKSGQLGCDAVIFDLEDAVAAGEKEPARTMLRAFLREPFPKPFFVRVNAAGTDYFEADLVAVAEIVPQGIVLPKATEASVRTASSWLDKRGKNHDSIQIIPLIENALAVETLHRILAASNRVSAAQLGAEDLTADLGIRRTETGEELGYPRNRLVYGCRARGLPAYDTPFTDFRNNTGLGNDSLVARNIGFEGKTCIHPSQIEIINETFTPSATEVEQAREIVLAAEQAGGGAFSLNGRMLDGPIIDQARRIIELADQIHQ